MNRTSVNHPESDVSLTLWSTLNVCSLDIYWRILCGFLCHRYGLLLLFLFTINSLQAQSILHFSVSDEVVVSNASHLPFWLWANQNGKIDPWISFMNLTDIAAEGKRRFVEKKHSTISYGATLVGGLEKEKYLQVNRLFGAIESKGWKLSAGMYYDEQVLEGLSTTNGNLARSLNYRPYPRVGLSTPDFKPLPFFKPWLKFRLEYDEGILNDHRYVKHAHLHHKAFYLKAIPKDNWAIQAGIEHFVMWGGTSQNEQISKMPSDFGSYLRYISGLRGDGGFPITDQLNVAGNQYGTYQLKVTRTGKKESISFYLSHPFEDFSGVDWRNYSDNLLGLHFHLNNSVALLSDFLYEFTDTRQQSITNSLYSWDEVGKQWKMNEYDNYFSHGVYHSGVTYHQMAMCSPLFAPVIIKNGISNGFGASRFVSHHFGMKGMLSAGLSWKTLLTTTHYLGTYSSAYIPAKNQLSGLLQLVWEKQKLPFDVTFAVAIDSGAMVQNGVGMQLGISREW